jgi:hypothetical protein
MGTARFRETSSTFPAYAADPAGHSVKTGRFKPISYRPRTRSNANGLIFRAVDDWFEASFCPGFRLFAVQAAALESLSVPRPDAGAHRAGDKDHETQGSIVHIQSDMVAVEDKGRCCQPESHEGIQPTHPESMQGMGVTQ